MFILKIAVLALCVFFYALSPRRVAADEAPLVGTWLGALEYRDFGNDTRVTLPTLLTVGRRDGAYVFSYIFDDGNGKVVRDRERVTLDLPGRMYVVDDGTPQGRGAYHIESVDGLSAEAPAGTFVALGAGTENDAPVDVRETVTVGAHTLTLLRETRARAANAAFAFRHRYRFSRIAPMTSGETP